MTKYDPQIIQRHADNLYRSARSTLILFTVLGILGGGAIGLALAEPAELGKSLCIGIGAVGTGLFGFIIGRSTAFALHVRAQTVLCQLAIEENTRKLVEAAQIRPATVLEEKRGSLDLAPAGGLEALQEA
jgi:hypothetical protein